MGLFSLFSQSLINEKYVFFDLETTGLNALLGDKIIEIAMLKSVNGKTVDTFYTLVNPKIPIPEEASKINNITDELLKDAPTFDSIAEKVLDFISDSTLVAHNASFDLGFLSVELGRAGISFDRWKAIDTLKIANSIFSGQRNKLESVMKRYNIMPDGALHRALNDTEILRKVYFELVEENEIRAKSIDELVKEYGYQGNNLHRSIPAIIREALVEKRAVRGDYITRDGIKIELKILPISPVWFDGRWYLYAKKGDNEQSIYIFCDRYSNIVKV